MRGSVYSKIIQAVLQKGVRRAIYKEGHPSKSIKALNCTANLKPFIPEGQDHTCLSTSLFVVFTQTNGVSQYCFFVRQCSWTLGTSLTCFKFRLPR